MTSHTVPLYHPAKGDRISPHRALLLRKTPLLANVAPAAIDGLLETARIEIFKGRSNRINPEELTKKAFFLLSGEVRLLRHTPDGQECLLRRVIKGQFFCLTTLFSGRSGLNQCVTTNLTEVLSWSKAQFEEFIRNNPGVYPDLARLMADQVVQERQMRTLSQCCKADIKVAAYLLYLAQTDRLPVSIDLRPTTVTAQELGIARETLSRSIHKLADQGLIRYQRGLIEFDDVSKLENYLDGLEQRCCCASPNKLRCVGH